MFHDHEIVTQAGIYLKRSASEVAKTVSASQHTTPISHPGSHHADNGKSI